MTSLRVDGFSDALYAMRYAAPLALLLSGCVTLYNPATGRQETVLDSAIEQNLGAIARAQMGLTSLRMGHVSDAEIERVTRIGKRLAAVSDRQDLAYRFGVVDENSLNAFSLPGATIYVHTGLLEKATDDELAAVLAHEVGHVAARHAAKHLQADLGLTLLLHVASAAGAGADAVRVGNSLYGLLRNGYSRQDELEADRLALRYTQRAGYDPAALVTFFAKMQREHPESLLDKALVWQRTHPLTSERIAQAQAELASMKGQRFCPTCGRTYGADKKFCIRDGTSLKEKASWVKGHESPEQCLPSWLLTHDS